MLKKYINLLFLLPAFILTACADDLGINHRVETIPEDQGIGTPLAFQVEDFGMRSRSVDFTDRALVKINTSWIGIFNRVPDPTTGHHKLVGFTEADQRFFEISSGKEYQNLIRAVLPAPEKKSGGYDQYFLLCVVNYQGVQGIDENGEKFDLQTKLQNINDWEDFVGIAVDTESAYTYPHDADSPLMAGFLRIKDGEQRSSTHVQVDQFNNNELFPSKFMEKDESDKFTDTDITTTYSEKDGYDTSDKIILLRRLVANFNVNIEVLNPDIQLTEVKYRRYNLPEAVYIIERRTVQADENGSNIEVPSDVDHAANFADKLWAKDGNHQKGYYDDREWNIAPNRNTQTGIWNFSFQHFANKHFARKVLEKYSDREEKNIIEGSEYKDEDGVIRYKYLFTALADDENDYNNNASYFVIKMHMVNTKTNQCAEAEYTIHEGYTSDETGTKREQSNNPAAAKLDSWEKFILQDFSCARNINTTYNIKVNGFNNIFLNVENNLDTEHEIEHDHYAGEGGTVWQLKYLNDPNNEKRHFYRDNIFDKTEKGHFENVLKGTKGEYNVTITRKDVPNKYWKFENAITFGPNPDIAFRLYGYTKFRKTGGNGQTLGETSTSPGLTGYNYNFSSDSFNHLDGLWPASAGDYSHYFNPEADEVHINSNLPEDMRNGVLIAVAGTEDYWSLGDFVKHAANYGESKTYDVYITQSELTIDDLTADDKELGVEAVKDNYVRAIYICDRNGEVDQKDQCSKKITVYCAAQYPDYSGHTYDVVYAMDGNNSMLPYNCDNKTYYIKNNLPVTYGWEYNDGKGMVFSNDPDIAFRLIGLDNNEEFVDLCYNFDLDEYNNNYPKFKNQWEVKSSITKKATYLEDLNKFSNTLEGLKISTKDGDKTLKEFIELYTGGNQPSVNPYAEGFTVGTYVHAGDVKKYIRRLYIFDKNAHKENFIMDETLDETYYQIYGVQQQPNDNRPTAPQITPLWHNRNVVNPIPASMADGFKEIVQTDNWCGIINSMVEIEWKTSTGYTEYEVVVGDRDPVKITAPDTGNEVKYQLITSDFEPGSYDVSINPVNTKPSVNNTFSKKLVLTDSKWNFNEMNIAKKVIDILNKREDTKSDGKIPNAWDNDARGFANVNFDLNGLKFINGSTYCLRGVNMSDRGYCFQTTFKDASRTTQSLMFYITKSGTLKIEYSGVGGNNNGSGERYFIFDVNGGTKIERKEMITDGENKATIEQKITMPQTDKGFTELYIYSFRAFRYFTITFTPD